MGWEWTSAVDSLGLCPSQAYIPKIRIGRMQTFSETASVSNFGITLRLKFKLQVCLAILTAYILTPFKSQDTKLLDFSHPHHDEVESSRLSLFLLQHQR